MTFELTIGVVVAVLRSGADDLGIVEGQSVGIAETFPIGGFDANAGARLVHRFLREKEVPKCAWNLRRVA